MKYSVPIPSFSEKLKMLFWAKVDKNGPIHPKLQTPCWVWMAGKNGNGYGRFNAEGDLPGGNNIRYAHRIAYTLCKGVIPEGLELDHLCDVRACVNPQHLEPVTHAKNSLRSLSAPAINARKTHCPQGHPYDTVTRSGRGCSICIKKSRKEQRRRQRQKEKMARLRLAKEADR